ncbi:hypothetical protein DL93DRAFT_1753545 [Clavulina sp. PMI_390]|nr:hypothetical protein DL93DRAFT_1753545 [Clavulina sp. PMI_390]
MLSLKRFRATLCGCSGHPITVDRSRNACRMNEKHPNTTRNTPAWSSTPTLQQKKMERSTTSAALIKNTNDSARRALHSRCLTSAEPWHGSEVVWFVDLDGGLLRSTWPPQLHLILLRGKIGGDAKAERDLREKEKPIIKPRLGPSRQNTPQLNSTDMVWGICEEN